MSKSNCPFRLTEDIGGLESKHLVRRQRPQK
jgi:hypothetical protein